jgi:magnesium transporter
MSPSHQADADPSEPTEWATFIGIVICLVGNVIISFALNIQRLAHERIQRKEARNLYQQESTYGTHPHPSKNIEVDEDSTQYLKSKLWWTGLVLMIIGETGNFVACKTPHPFLL